MCDACHDGEDHVVQSIGEGVILSTLYHLASFEARLDLITGYTHTTPKKTSMSDL
jgi:hypothetical protein